jgi:hypothetical protein
MATIIDFLKTLKEPYRTQAIANTDELQQKINTHSMSRAIDEAFVWGKTEQGDRYWDDLYRALLRKDKEKYIEEKYLFYTKNKLHDNEESQ